MKKFLFAFNILFLSLIIFSGCGPSSVVVSARPQPPAYVRPAAPRPNYLWVNGEWVRHGRGYVYREGYWAAPRRGYRQYVEGHWQQRRQGWYWVSGHWN